MRKLLAFVGLLAIVYALAAQHGVFSHGAPAEVAAADCDGKAIESAYRAHQRRVEVCASGVIAKVLRDDLEGSRHQRFIVRVPDNTVLVVYNIDIAPRIEGLQRGAAVELMGEYEWNPQGGVVHWTHRDPAGRHPAGWVRYGGRVYQ